MPMDLSAITRSLNRQHGVATSTPAVAKNIPDPVTPAPVTQDEADCIWAEAEKNFAKPKGDYADLCERLTALEAAVNEMTQALALVNKHVNATQKMLKKAGKDGNNSNVK